MKKRIYLTMIFILCFLIGYPQLKKANYLYDHLKFSDAIDYYLGAVNSKSKEDRYEAMEKLALCYVNINDVPNSIYWLEKIVEQAYSDPNLELLCGKQLMRDEQYEKAAEHFANYNNVIPNSEEGIAYENFARTVDELLFDPTIEIVPVDVLNSEYSEFSPIKYRGQVLITSDRDFKRNKTYGWTNAGYKKLYSSTDAQDDDFFRFPVDQPKEIHENYNRSLNSGPITFSKAGSSFFVTHTVKKREFMKKDNDYVIHLGLYYGEIIAGEKAKEKEFPYNDDTFNVGHATLSNDGNTVIFVSDSPEGYGHGDLYSSTRVGDDWTEPVNLGENVNGFGNEVFPFLLNDTILYFSSDSHKGYGGLDAFVSYQAEDGSWTTPENLRAPLNSSYDDFGICVYDDQLQGYITSDRPGGMGSDDIYAWRREVLPPDPAFRVLCGTVGDMFTLEPIEGAMVFVLSTSTRQVYLAETDSLGNFEVQNPEGELFIYHAMKEDYWDDVYTYRVSAFATGRQCLDRDLLLEPGGVEKIVLKKIIYYDLDKDFIRKDASLTLDSLIVAMKDERYDVALTSHTDIRASNSYNQDLSNRRALNAKRYLAQHGIDEKRILMRGFGENDPAVPGQKLTEPQHQLNRRTELKIVLHRESNIRFGFDYSAYQNGDILPVEIFPVGFFGSRDDDSE